MSLYARLGVAASATPVELRDAWRALVRTLHPDLHPDDPEAVDRLAAVNAAYTVLSDVDKRRQYDQYGEDAASAFFDESRLKRSAPKPRPVERGEDLQVELSLSAAEARSGGIHEVVVEPARSCAACAGTGWRRAGRACSKCEGGTIPGIGPYRVQVPGAIVDGQVLVVPGAGRAGRGRGAEPGDLLVSARVAGSFSRSAIEVVVRVPCPVQVRRDGGRVRVPLPSGKAVKMTVPAGSSVGRRLRLRGKGGAGVDLIAVLVEGPPPPVPVAAVKIHLG